MRKYFNLAFYSFFISILVITLLQTFSAKSYANQPIAGTWTFLGLSSYSINNLIVDPNNTNTLYAISNNSGILKSTDSGTTWNYINNGFPDVSSMDFSALVINPNNSNILYAGAFGSQYTNLIPGVFKSTNGGINWTEITNQISWPGVMDMSIDPSNSNNVYVAIYSHCGGVWKTIDGGTNWTQHPPTCDIYQLALDLSHPNTIYAASDTVYKTIDRANTWTNPSNNGINGVSTLAINPQETNTLYAIANNKIYKSTDGAHNWSHLSNAPSGSFGRHALTVDPTRINTIYAGINGVYQSTNGGANWTNISNGLPNNPQISSLIAPINTPNVLYAVTNSGIYMYGLQTSSPTPTPTPTTQPIPNSSLPVPLLKQGIFPYTDNNPAWEGQEFDHATQYGGFGCGTTIAQCGCAMTSLAMILQYYKVNKLPDGTTLNPGTFNTWLKNNNGYFRDQGMNPYIATKVAKKAKNQNPEFAYDALEYKRIQGENKTQLTSDLQNGWPAILEEPGHFITATGIDNNTFSINDPAYNRTKLNSYGNTFLSLNRYIPSNTDLSYLVFAVDKEVNITLKDSTENAVGDSYINQPIADATLTNPTGTPEAKLKILAYAKPPTGTYTLEITSPSSKQYTLDQYIIDQEGNDKVESIKGIISPNQKELFNISFDKQISNNSYTNKQETFASTLEDIKALRHQQLLHFSIEISTTALIKNAEKLHEKGLDKPAKQLIDQAINIINKSPKRFVDPIAKEILLYDFNELSKLLKN